MKFKEKFVELLQRSSKRYGNRKMWEHYPYYLATHQIESFSKKAYEAGARYGWKKREEMGGWK